MTTTFRLSVAIPLYNEETTVEELLRRVRAVLDAVPGGPHEVVIVDDGSSDATLERLEEAAREDSRLRVVALSRNFGHQAALTAALDHVSGDAIVVMDGDLQDQPEMIPTLLERYRAGFDVVYVRRTRRKEPWWLRLAYHTFYRVLARIADLRLPLDAGDFALLSSRVVAALRRTPEYHRYLRGLRTWVGFRQTALDAERDRRYAGRSKYSLSRLVGLGLNGIFAFSILPLRLAALLGGVAIALSSAFGAYALYAKLVLRRSPQGFTALLLAIVFLSGVNLFFLGVIGEYIGRVYEQVKGRPVYVVRSLIGQRTVERSEGGSGVRPA
jgi:glycosyltransferase involved in cell wall biosynthesis